MKISKMSWLFLVIGIVVIAALSLGMTHSAQSDQQKQLQTKLAEANRTLALIDNDALLSKQTQLTQDVSKYAAQIQAAKGRLNATWDSIEATRAIFAVAAPLNVDVLSVSSSGLGKEELAGTPCDTLSLDFQVQGTMLTLRDFVIGLSQKFPSGIVNLVQLDNQPAQSEASPPPEKDARGTIHLVIYIYGGK